MIPIPIQNSTRYYLIGRPEPVKYALYFKKSFMKRFAVSGIVSRDHMRPPVNGSPQIQQIDDFLQTKQQWWWSLRLLANF